MGFALFTTPHFAIAAKDALQEMVFDSESKSVLHTEMAKKNLFVKRGIYMESQMFQKASPEITSKVYSKLAHFQKNVDWDAAVQLVVKATDPWAQSLPTNDWYRLHRSLEIIKASL
ncbi:tRNA dimethylallyltransferase 9 [Camellia lanceoleosa]|uniref:tRNA dimethylallyltransferase 9 n=1 Tax=Camellia lanceoleosa TaxID=1840588 RepID=A0ACC0H6E7_9ERIC|nr:tRNA dimethylallyltransferase 9 [Camellia lanceoleosa]